jgi:hypothetical protein
MSHEPDDRAGRMDLSPLDPLADDGALERFVSRVRTAATAELLRRQAPPRLGDLIVHMRQPILATLGVLATASILVLWSVRLPQRRTGDAVATAMGVPDVLADWTYAAKQPSVGDLLGSGRSQ